MFTRFIAGFYFCVLWYDDSNGSGGERMYPNEYIEFLVHFHGDRDYFECHEILEEYWKKTDPTNKNSIWVGLILLAVANYHHRRENYRGAKRTLEKSIIILQENETDLQKIGLDSILLLKLLNVKLIDITQEEKYSSYSLPITDQSLLKICDKLCIQKNYTWGKESELQNKALIHRHALRDRSEVIHERLKALKKGRE